ncbi:hypothetical protein [Chitinophaga arvensicola]|uniref:Uncharacterized protein n=1 Tax=Chitinophaga arvensicola TaxID=29529 RepID=A0A1I0NZE2_9BACT|nr:hypothetical protein [Chitinophaga arvensicola]SEW07212.1 hypothetical protein SAMN04488122_0465 [Chitinophaga arvensicola]
MRSFVALMTCVGCIAWIHSCEKRLLGVRLEKNLSPIDQPQQLPVAVLPAALPANYISLVSSTPHTINPPVSHSRTRPRTKKQPSGRYPGSDSALFNQALVKGQYTIYKNSTP